ncbi:hypothetical protein ABN357_14945 [Providencia rettgeri]|uniref:hypothetical protein n=1 Tax=Providencia TaxID=586 RepID=UPI00234916BD|nr:hypothetical protein [Providencia sp. PROV148]
MQHESKYRNPISFDGEQDVKLSKLLKHGKFVGYGLSANGKLLSGQTNVVINTEAPAITFVTVTFATTPSMVDDAPEIHLNDYLTRGQ